MIIAVDKISSALSKITALTSGDKQIPGVLLRLSENQLTVCYTNGHKSVVEYIECTTEEGDHFGDVVVDYTMFNRAIQNCQPSGIIKVGNIQFKYGDNNIISIEADQTMEIIGDDGNVVDNKVLAHRKMDIRWDSLDSSARTAVLSRMNYESIFEPGELVADEVNRDDFKEQLSRTSVEKGKTIYISTKNHCVFVNNQAHLTIVPAPMKELTTEDEDEIRGSLEEAGVFSPENFEKALDDAKSTYHYSATISNELAKAIISIIGNTKSDKVNIFTRDKAFNIFITSEESGEKVGIWFEMPQASRVHLGAVQRFQEFNYNAYQLRFFREFLDNNIKAVLNSTNDTNVQLKFKVDDEGQTIMCIDAASAGKSISDNYSIVIDDIVDPNSDIVNKTFNVSIKVLADMLSQLKTTYIAMDFAVDASGLSTLRLSEINEDKLRVEYENARKDTERLCTEQGIQFIPDQTPTPIELKLAMREKVLGVSQYTALAK